ncbi:hypothetical protein FPSE_06090 [Fusarium pseudograminearum CS3096]|uniref:Uncharacterized protein n=1 Tax=Fusarium pseudograminearum (strain CS3096) TaxID=1028729 RepID=K3VHS6_FUSPC|nr:hypothetical protein FPSE_06090 [Fusarium pseudograminearum CS3096]EKJ73744.1 hypothetical protein FPSE_06090 [Fusarium pseudograminearum CS3096]KAF0639045.1 hypothetical protein FPSE5266_06090 [Fusarium pseudograminearum]
MPRVTHFDTDVGRLPNGMERISYDDRTNMYTFRAADGTLWESSSGNAYGELTEVGVRTPANPEFVIRNPQFYSPAEVRRATDLFPSRRPSTPPHHRAADAFTRGIPTRAATTRRPAGPSAEARPRSATTGTRPAAPRQERRPTAPRQEHQSAAPRQRQSTRPREERRSTGPRQPQSARPRQQRRSTAPARQPGALQRTATSCLTSLRQRARSVRITLTGSVSKTLEEAKAAISKI